MGFIGVRTNEEEDKDIEDLEKILTALQPHKPWDKSKLVKEAVKIARYHLKNTYFYDQCLTPPQKEQTVKTEKVFIERVPSDQLDIHGKRKKLKY